MDKCEQDQLGQIRSAIENISASILTISNKKEPPVEPVETEETNIDLNPLNSPLQNPLILNHVFDFLELKDIEQCRLVCNKWNQLSISFLEKISIVTIGLRHSPEAFKEFSENSEINFRAFKLANFELPNIAWSTASVVEFLLDRRDRMHELIIENTEVIGHRQRPRVFSARNYFDISPHIGNHLTHLTIVNDSGSKFIVNANVLTSLKSIYLAHCALEISENCVLSPEKFELNHVALVNQGRMVEDFLINGLLNFEKLKDLSLDGETSTKFDVFIDITDGTLLKLDLNEKVTLDNLSLKYVALNGLKNSQWEIREKLKLRCVSLEFGIGIKFRELDFGQEIINLDLLPESLEKLTLSEIENEGLEYLTILSPPGPLFSLPNLKYFQLLTVYRDRSDEDEKESEEDDDYVSDESTDDDRVKDKDINVDKRDCSKNENDEDEDSDDWDDDEDDNHDVPPTNPLSYLNFFIDCPNLTTVKLLSKRPSDSNCVCQRFQTEWIPKSTENLFLDGNIKAIGEEYKLNKLVIENNNLQFLMSTLTKLQSNHLVLNLNSESLGKFSKFRHLEKIFMKLIIMPYESFAIGSLAMTMDIPAFKKSFFSNFVDERSDYYLFKNKKGQAIKEWEFKKMLEH